MENKFPYRFFYNLNNIAFTGLLLFSIFIFILIVLQLFQPNINSDITYNEEPVSIFILSKIFVSNVLCVVALYQSFLALYSVKNNIYTVEYWTKKFSISAYFFIGAALVRLFEVSKQNSFFPFKYGLGYGKNIIVTNYSLYLLVIALFLLFISKLKPELK